jgi:putative hydrolase of the HAD superfamily
MQRYKHIYIDLDRTLWDFNVNSAEALRDLFLNYSLDGLFPAFEIFHGCFEKHNRMLWDRYSKGDMKKDILRTLRFQLTLREFGINQPGLAEKLGEDYIRICPTKTGLLPHTIQALDYLQSGYNLYIITNGFYRVQSAKLTNSGLGKYFKKVITSESTGYMKPRAEIFDYAVTSVNARKDECVMVGDDLEIDIIGAKNAGIDQVYFNPERIGHLEKPSYEIDSLLGLLKIF